MKRSVSIVSVCAILLYAEGCGDDSGGNAASISISSSGMYGEELLLQKGVGELITITAKDEAGNKVELSGSVSWETSEPDVISVREMGSTGLAEGLVDWFDASGLAEDADPSSTLTAGYKGLSVSIDAFVLLDADGMWTVTIGSDAPLSVPLIQQGRVVGQPLAGMEGELRGATLTVESSDITLTGTFTSRDEISGTGVDADGNVKSWSATR